MAKKKDEMIVSEIPKKEAEVIASKIAKRKYISKRYWTIPGKRSKQYASELKNNAHDSPYSRVRADGSVFVPKKNGQELTDIEKGVRMGYLQCQSDHVGVYKYAKARQEGKSTFEAKKISQTRERKKQSSSEAPVD